LSLRILPTTDNCLSSFILSPTPQPDFSLDFEAGGFGGLEGGVFSESLVNKIEGGGQLAQVVVAHRNIIQGAGV
jgi:hypothetical protein